MKSNKQRRAEIMARRHGRAEAKRVAKVRNVPFRQSLANPSSLPWLVAMNNSFGAPRRAYSDYAFICRDCAKPQVWAAERQRW